MALTEPRFTEQDREFFSETARRKREHDLELHAAYAAHPDLYEHNMRLQRLWLGRNRGLLSQAEAEKEGESITASLVEGFAGLGLSYEYEPSCAVCGDSGIADGEACACLKAFRAQSQRFSRIAQGGSFEEFSAAVFSDEERCEMNGRDLGRSVREDMVRKKADLEEYCRRFPDAGNLLFAGAAGTGKTYLAVCAARELEKRGYRSRVVTSVDLLDCFSDAMFARQGAGERTALDAILGADFLVVDDLGCERATDYSSECLYRLISDRSASGARTLITTALDGPELKERYRSVLFSRLAGLFEWTRFYGTDRRVSPKMHKNDTPAPRARKAGRS